MPALSRATLPRGSPHSHTRTKVMALNSTEPVAGDQEMTRTPVPLLGPLSLSILLLGRAGQIVFA